ncbi:MAG TPA: DUF58 domain-containing protein [Pirellulaceae bacterium]|nr:DUF58 domain-containing protein [Pirellulaceae bacterium]
MKWFFAVLVVLAIAWLTGLSLVAYAMYALLLLLVASRWLASQWASSVSAERECNRLTARVGEKVAVVVTIRNGGWLPIVWLLVEDLLPKQALLHDPPNLGVAGERTELLTLAPGRGKSLRYQLTCNRRGYYQLGPLTVETGDLFGLHRRHRVLTVPHFLLVYPPVVAVGAYQLASRRPIGEVLLTHRLYEDPTRISGVRQYQPGDPLNRVHWRATARTGTLHSKVYEPSTVAGLTLLLDFHRDAHDRRHEPVRSELAVTAAASLAHVVYQLGQQVGLVSNGRDAADRIRTEGWQQPLFTRQAARDAASMRAKSDRLEPLLVPTRAGDEQFLRILETLARIELTDGLTLSQLILETARRLPRDATIVAILPRVTATEAIALSMLKRQGFAVEVLINVYEEIDFAEMASWLYREGIGARHLQNEAALVQICETLATA